MFKRLLLFLPSLGYTQLTITTMATGMVDDVMAFYRMIGALAFLAGIAFFIVAILKFKQFKDNPQQTPVGTPFMLLLIAVLLAFLPSFISPVGVSLFGATTLESSQSKIESVSAP